MSVRPGETIRGAFAAVVANTPASIDDELYVTVGAFDGHRQLWGPCEWVPGDALPEDGDDCLLIFDEAETPWVLVATPASSFDSGSGPPAATLGSEGGFYLDLSTLRLYGPKTASGWPSTALGRLLPLTPTYAQLKAG